MKNSELEKEKTFIEYLVKTLKEKNLSSLEVKSSLANKHIIEVKINNANSFSKQETPEAIKSNFENLKKEEVDSLVDNSNTSSIENVIKSPMVGTIYLSPSPEEPTFIHVGKKIKKGDTILIIEAMKTMNHIPSTLEGTVKEILVNNESPVEFDTPLVIVE